jgi:2-hydroxychromene-2-carboxylate isomerase
MPRTLDFFFFYGSIHTYLSVMRIAELGAAAGLEIRWRPFNLRAILIEQNNTSFARTPVRLAYSWRDIARRAARLRIPWPGRRPTRPIPIRRSSGATTGSTRRSR